MKHFRWLKAVTLCTAIFMGFALNSCSEEENSMIPNDDLVEVQSALSTATITKGAVTVRNGPGTWYERIGGLHYGKTVNIKEEHGGWLKIEYGDAEGWIYRSDTDLPSDISSVSCSREIADFIRDNNPDGYNVIFTYNGSDQAAEFHGQAYHFSNEYHTVNISDGVLTKDVYKKVINYNEFKNAVLQAGNAVIKCLADNPREGFDDSKCSQIKNLTIMTHGFENGLNFGGGYGTHFYSSNIPDFGAAVKGYVNANALRIQLYACDTARNENTASSWFERWSGGVIKQEDPFTGGKGSFAQLLSEEMGAGASVFGHTTAGHLSGNYCARSYGRIADGAVHGRHMFDVYFPQSFVAEQAARIGKDEDTTRTSMYEYYTGAFDDDKRARDSFMDPEGKGQRMRDGWLKKNP